MLAASARAPVIAATLNTAQMETRSFGKSHTKLQGNCGSLVAFGADKIRAGARTSTCTQPLNLDRAPRAESMFMNTDG